MSTFFMTVDNFFLTLTKKGARIVYVWTGVNNFQLFSVFFTASALFFMLGIPLALYEKDNPAQIAFVKLGDSIRYLMLWFAWDNARSFAQKPGPYLNPCRKGRCVVVRLITIAIALLYVGMVLPALFLFPMRLYWNPSVLATLFFETSMALSFCLVSIEPEPPSESKIRKTLNWMKSVFGSQPAAEPA